MRRILLELFKKSTLFIVGIMFISLTWNPPQTEAQALRFVAGNTFSGAATGAMLGGAQMALNNDEDTLPLRYGVGIGTLAGMAVGVYDTGREAEYLYGTFRRTRYTGTIIMMDTFLGAATGAVVGMSIALLREDDEIVDGLRYGAGAGAWAGFGFGIIDGFLLREYEESDTRYVSSMNNQSSSDSVNGLFALQSNKNFSIGFINPSLYRYADLQNEQFTIQNSWGLEVTNLKIGF